VITPSDTSRGQLEHLADAIARRHPARGGDPSTSYVARLLHRGPDAVLKKLGEEATEVVLAAKDVSVADEASAADLARQHLVAELADLWFHSLVLMEQAGVRPTQVLDELRRREGMGGLEEKALRKAQTRDQDPKGGADDGI
jgi:phosphoribosyl-ATP pyrophosphohydrolase